MFKNISCGYQHLVTVDDNGDVWEYNYYSRVSTPGRISSNLNIVAVSSGKGFTIALDNLGFAWGKGTNQYGELGIGRSGSTVASFEKIPLPNITAIACGNDHAFFVTEEGTMWGTGRNQHGQLGIPNDLSSREAPTLVSYLEDCVSVACGAAHSVALCRAGKAYSCGLNNYRQLGYDNRRDSASKFRVIDLDNIIEVSCGTLHSVFLDQRGEIFETGDTKKYHSSLMKVVTTKAVNHIYAGGHNTIFITDDGIIGKGSQFDYENELDKFLESKRITKIAANRCVAMQEDNGSIWVFNIKHSPALEELQRFSHILSRPVHSRCKSARK
mmetsp:Transcript_24833/g.31603  ORF Transcript_24833/g.31603 Transcript_24833/m.31603 type:complete len:327 (-) Transcript_24833:90-1070(-)